MNCTLAGSSNYADKQIRVELHLFVRFSFLMDRFIVFNFNLEVESFLGVMPITFWSTYLPLTSVDSLIAA